MVAVVVETAKQSMDEKVSGLRKRQPCFEDGHAVTLGQGWVWRSVVEYASGLRVRKQSWLCCELIVTLARHTVWIRSQLHSVVTAVADMGDDGGGDLVGCSWLLASCRCLVYHGSKHAAMHEARYSNVEGGGREEQYNNARKCAQQSLDRSFS